MPSADLLFADKQRAGEYAHSLVVNYGYKIAGVDECGRGSLCGPVVAGCVILPPDHTIEGIKDSKKMSPNKRKKVAEHIMASSFFGIGVAEASEVDECNILVSARRAAVRALDSCLSSVSPDFVLCDGGLKLGSLISLPTASVIKGDHWFECVSAASIIAKVYHDEQMAIYHEMWPHYNWIKNQGYGTKDHTDAIKKYGISPIHRLTFGICKTATGRE